MLRTVPLRHGVDVVRASAHGNYVTMQLDAIEVAAGGLSTIGVEGGTYGRV